MNCIAKYVTMPAKMVQVNEGTSSHKSLNILGCVYGTLIPLCKLLIIGYNLIILLMIETFIFMS